MPIATKNAIVALRFSRLARIPTAVYSAELLVEAGIPVVAFEYGLPEEPVAEVPGKIPRLRLAWPRYPWMPHPLHAASHLIRTYLHLRARLSKDRPRLLIAHGLQEEFLALLLHRSLGIPYIVHLHEVYERKDVSGLNALLFAGQGKALRQAEFVICSEAGRAKIYQARHGLKAPFLAFNCPRRRRKSFRSEIRRRWGVPEGAVALLYVGGLDDKNCILEAIGAVAEVPESHLVLVGWSNAEFRKRIDDEVASLRVASRVTFLGEIEDKWEALDAADLGYCVYQPDELRTQHLATASNKLMESLAAGLPVITSANSDFREFLAKYPVGISVTSLDRKGVAQALSLLCRARETREKLARAAIAAHTTELCYENQYASILDKIRRDWFPESVPLTRESATRGT